MNNKNLYWNNAILFKTKLIKSIEEILKVYGNELILILTDLNLLERIDNCIESSTSIGFCIEEFITSKLINYTKNNYDDNEIKIFRNLKGKTQTQSYDFLSSFKNELFLVNLKANKGNNNAVSAIKQLYFDYVKNEEKVIKHFMVLKMNYKINLNEKNIRVINIKSIESYYLEEVDFKNGHKQDNRNWSEEFNPNSGRLQISKKFIKNNRLNEEDISYEKTKEYIKNIYNRKTI